MTNTDFMTAKIGSQLRTVKITNIEKETVNANGRDSEKIVFTVWDDIVKREFKISDCWIKANDDLKIVGLWYLASDGNVIAPNSALAKLLHALKCDALIKLMNRDINVYPDPKDYLVIIVGEITETELANKLKSMKSTRNLK